MIKIIKLLKKVALKLQIRERRKVVQSLHKESERTDVHFELAEKRIAISRQIQEQMEDRAYRKLSEDLERTNKRKAEHAARLSEIDKL